MLRVVRFSDTTFSPFRFPTRVPAVRDRFRYGLPQAMPIYGSHVAQDGNVLLVYGWVKDPKIRALTHTSSSFPGQFLTQIELDETTFGFASRYDAHQLLIKRDALTAEIIAALLPPGDSPDIAAPSPANEGWECSVNGVKRG